MHRVAATRLLPPIAQLVREGLMRTPKSLPPFLFYDAAGSELFERITALPEYYLTRTERQILLDHADEIVAAAGPGVTVIELGAGSAAKTGVLLRALLRRQPAVVYRPVDISRTALEAGRRRLDGYAGLRVQPIVGDFEDALPRMQKIRGRKLVLYIGSSIGNYDPPAAQALLRAVAANLAPGDMLLLGTDLVKPARILLPAYDDAQGVTAAFNKNMLARINRELGASFELDAFRHVALWNGRESRIEMHLESVVEQEVVIADLDLAVQFDRHERLHTENSYKFRVEDVDAMLRQAGFAPRRFWSDEKEWFALHVAERLFA